MLWLTDTTWLHDYTTQAGWRHFVFVLCSFFYSLKVVTIHSNYTEFGCNAVFRGDSWSVSWTGDLHPSSHRHRSEWIFIFGWSVALTGHVRCQERCVCIETGEETSGRREVCACRCWQADDKREQQWGEAGLQPSWGLWIIAPTQQMETSCWMQRREHQEDCGRLSSMVSLETHRVWLISEKQSATLL